MQAQWIETDGTTTEVAPNDGKHFTLEELQGLVRGEGPNGKGDMITIVDFPDGRQMVANDEGRLLGLERNEKAEAIWREAFPIEEYPHNNSGILVGNILIAPKGMIQ